MQIQRLCALLACLTIGWATTSLAQDGGDLTAGAGSDADAAAGTAPDATEGAGPGGAVGGATEAAPTGAADGTDASDAVAEESFNIKLRSIEEKVNQLKEKIFQSKARLIQLQEVVLHGTITGSKARLVHLNEMGSSFRLRQVKYALDGAPIFTRVDSGGGELNDEAEIEIFNGGISPGNHQVSVFLEYHGYGYGIFSYLEGYKFKIKSSCAFTAEEGKLTTVTIVGFEQGGFTTQLKDRPAVDCRVEREFELRKNNAASKSNSAREGN